MFYKEWEILLVDDEPDVLSVSQLAMHKFEVYGLPLRIETAASKAEAIDFLNTRYNIRFGLAVAFIDVVMENDTAGLDVCRYIREDLNNRLSQLYIRTGQPGVAPERTVIDRYDINGYFTKVEATEDKLYSLVKTGVRQFLWSTQAYGIVEFFDTLMQKMGSPDGIWQGAKQLASLWRSGMEPVQDEESRMHVFVNDRLLPSRFRTDSAEVEALRARLDELPGTALSPYGDKYVRGADNYQMIRVVKQPNQAGVDCIFSTRFEPPLEIIGLWHKGLAGMAAAWTQSMTVQA